MRILLAISHVRLQFSCARRCTETNLVHLWSHNYRSKVSRAGDLTHSGRLSSVACAKRRDLASTLSVYILFAGVILALVSLLCPAKRSDRRSPTAHLCMQFRVSLQINFPVLPFKSQNSAHTQRTVALS